MIKNDQNETENEKKVTRYKISRPRSRHGHKYYKCKMYLGIMTVVILSNTEATPKQHWKVNS